MTLRDDMGKVSDNSIILNARATQIESLLEDILGVLRRHLQRGRFRVFLYGSWASLSARPTSDVDIAIMGTEPVRDTIFMKIRQELENLSKLRSIDIVDLNKADREFREAVLQASEELFL